MTATSSARAVARRWRATVPSTGHRARAAIAADGAEPAMVSIVEKGTIDVALGGDRYRLPATIGAAR